MPEQWESARSRRRPRRTPRPAAAAPARVPSHAPVAVLVLLARAARAGGVARDLAPGRGIGRVDRGTRCGARGSSRPLRLARGGAVAAAGVRPAIVGLDQRRFRPALDGAL